MNRAMKYGRNQIKGYSKYQSALRAGYAPATARNAYLIERSQSYKNFLANLLSAMDEIGLNNAFVAQKMMDALEAKKSTFYRGKEIIGKQGDHMVHLKAVDLYFKILLEAHKLQENKRQIIEAKSVDEVDEMSTEQLNELLTSFC
jgi:phage terminase small subunit